MNVFTKKQITTVTEVIELYENAVKRDHTSSMRGLACLYASENSFDDALDWLDRAHKLGDSDASFELGNIYAFGLWGVDCDNEKAMGYFVAASTGGHDKAYDTIQCYKLTGKWC